MNDTTSRHRLYKTDSGKNAKPVALESSCPWKGPRRWVKGALIHKQNAVLGGYGDAGYRSQDKWLRGTVTGGHINAFPPDALAGLCSGKLAWRLP